MKLQIPCVITAAISLALLASSAQAADLVVHAAETGVGKFHRLDNSLHPYGAQSEWKDYVYPAGLDGHTGTMSKNPDGSYTVFFTNLQELLTNVVKVSTLEQRPVDLLNIEAHGMPGGMWFPKSAAQRDGFECFQWRAAAYGPDRDNYDQYYSEVTKSEIDQFRQYAQAASHGHQPCVTGLAEWTEVSGLVPGLASAFAPRAEIHLVSCIVGLGNTGNTFTGGLAKLLFPSASGQVLSSINFGLGDWSMPEGMGFWDYLDDAQLAHDNEIYPVNRSDREIWQKGAVRFAQSTGGQVTVGVFGNLQYVDVNTHFVAHSTSLLPDHEIGSDKSNLLRGQHARIPGTGAVIDLSL